MKIVKYCDSVYSAHLICGALANNGVESQVINETISSVLPYSSAIDSLQVQVVVDDIDFDKAVEILRYSDENITKIYCPKCGSDNITFRFPSDKKRKIIGRYFLFFLALLSGNSPGYIRRSNHCEDCNSDFNNN